jgi:hypothetical protein
MTTPSRDRLGALLKSTVLNGVDFVALDPSNPGVLVVHFLNATPLAAPGVSASIGGGDSVPAVPVAPIAAGDWGVDADGRPTLTLHPQTQGDFSDYTLTIAGAALDPMFASSVFSFKALCPSDFDCAPAPDCCPPDDVVAPPIDRLAKDFLSFRQALLDFSSLRYPHWQERSEADFGVMFLEALSAVADELSYLQDRVAAEADLATATQRRSLVSLARLIDYEPRPQISAAGLLQCQVTGTTLPAGARVDATGPDGGLIPFEIGTGLADATVYAVSPMWNDGIAPYWWDDGQRCLKCGATSMWVQGSGFGFRAGQALLLQTELPGESIRQIVHLTAPGFESADPLFPPGGPPTPVTRIDWAADDALLREHDLTRTRLAGNLLPVTQGRRMAESFAIGAAPTSAPSAPLTIARRGPNGGDAEPNLIHRYGLSVPGLAWLMPDDVDTDAPAAAPEVRLTRSLPTPVTWTYATSLLDADSLETAFTLDPVAWRTVDRDNAGRPLQSEMDGDGGWSIRFGDGLFGAAPSEGDYFQLAYRVGLGAAGNVSADSVTTVDPAWSGLLTSARNPFPMTGGADQESADHVRRMAPQAFRALQYRAVRPEDYEAAAESLPWVQKAGTSFRWTGSWLTVFTAVDPFGSEIISTDEHVALVQLLNRRRLAGYESYAPPPRYVSIDLRIVVCADPLWLPGDVEQGVLQRLGDSRRCDGQTGFFFADRFTFGTPLYRSRLEAAIQSTPGVNGVLSIAYRRRGATTTFIDLPQVYRVGPMEILRVDNDPSWPERGVIRVIPEGGR